MAAPPEEYQRHCIVSGYFNPIHPGHISLIRDVNDRWPDCRLIAIVNNDAQVQIKDAVPFMDEETRCSIVESIKGVDEVILSIDTTGTVIDTLRHIRQRLHVKTPVSFCNGGDRNSNIPEQDYCEGHLIHLEYGFGDNKKYASSELLTKAASWINLRNFWRNFADELLAELDITDFKS